MKPIETRYKGCRFRSRLEARWAVFFDALDVRWEYEREGYNLGGGDLYLPDFWLPDSQLWVEVKGKDLSDREERVAQALATSTMRPVAVVGNDRSPVGRGSESALAIGRIFYPETVRPNRLAVDGLATIYQCRQCALVRIASLNDSDWYCHGCGEFTSPFDTDALRTAEQVARSARFEHGESGAG